MLRRILLPVIFVVLGYGFWLSPSFKEICAGVAVFLFGMLAMEQGFKALTGGLLERLLARTTDRLWKSVGFGIVTTTLMQSSSLVSVIAISFLGAGMISLASGIGIVFGANLGTTTGAWLVAGFGLKVSISAYAMPMLVFGVLLVFQRSPTLKGVGYVLAGLGFLFLGIHYMKEGFEAFEDRVDLTAYALTGVTGLLLYVLLGVAATVVMQSSHASMVLTITALASGQITYENALALAIGSNIGTTITAILGALGSNTDGKRLAAAHLLFNVVTGAVAMVFIVPLVAVVDRVSAALGIAADDFTMKLAVFHTLFNTLGIALMLPATSRLVALLERVLRAPPLAISQPAFLNEAAKGLPDVAIEATRRESAHLFKNTLRIVADTVALPQPALASEAPLPALVAASRTPVAIDVDSRYEQNVKPLFGAIIDFVSHAQAEARGEQSEDLFALGTACRHMVEAVKSAKHLHKNLARHMNSPDAHVRGQYDALRAQVARALRAVGDGSLHETDAVTTLSFDDVKLELVQGEALLGRTLTTEIRDRRLTPAVATSLINDSRYAREIGTNLLEAAQLLYSRGDRAARAAMADMALDSRDLQDITHPEAGSP